jgi:hypothetical protein
MATMKSRTLTVCLMINKSGIAESRLSAQSRLG